MTEPATITALLDEARQMERDGRAMSAVAAIERAMVIAGENESRLRLEAFAGRDAHFSIVHEKNAEIERLREAAKGQLVVVNAAKAAIEETAALRARVAELEAGLKPFSDIAGEMFARNWNDDRIVIALDNPDKSNRVRFSDFRRARTLLEKADD